MIVISMQLIESWYPNSMKIKPQMLATRIGRTEVIIAKIVAKVKGLKKDWGSSKAALKLSLPNKWPYINLNILKLAMPPRASIDL